MNQNAYSPETIPHARLDIQLRFDGQEGSMSLRVNGVPVNIGSGESGGGQDVGKVNSSSPPILRTLDERWRDFRRDALAYRLFFRFVRHVPGALALIGLFQFALYWQFFAQEPNFLARYGWWIFYMDISVVALAAMLGYLRSYHLNTPHMLGMMIGMVVGMQVGTMLGAVVGATNGLFVGALTGMFCGGLSGVYIGCRCGSTLAVIQGLMSGGMAGTMGAMLIAMMLDDHVLFFMPFFTLFNLLILLGFTYLFYEEAVECCRCKMRQLPGFLSLAGISLLATTALALLMLYGPKGPMVWTGETPKPMDMGSMKPGGMMDMGGMK